MNYLSPSGNFAAIFWRALGGHAIFLANEGESREAFAKRLRDVFPDRRFVIAQIAIKSKTPADPTLRPL